MNKTTTKFNDQPNGLFKIEKITKNDNSIINKKYYKNNPDFIDVEIEHYENEKPLKVFFKYRENHPEHWIYSEEEKSDDLMTKKIKFDDKEPKGLKECMVYYDKQLNPIYKEIKYNVNNDYFEMEKIFYDLKNLSIERIETYYKEKPDSSKKTILFYDILKKGLLKKKETHYNDNPEGKLKSTDIYDDKKTTIIVEYKKNPKKIIKNIVYMDENNIKIKGETYFEEGKIYNLAKLEVFYENNKPKKTIIYDQTGDIIEEKDNQQNDEFTQ